MARMALFFAMLPLQANGPLFLIVILVFYCLTFFMKHPKVVLYNCSTLKKIIISNMEHFDEVCFPKLVHLLKIVLFPKVAFLPKI